MLGLLSIVLMLSLLPDTAAGNVAIPFTGYALGGQLLIFLLIIAIEFAVLKIFSPSVPRKKCLKAVTTANIISLFAGLPVAMLSEFITEMMKRGSEYWFYDKPKAHDFFVFFSAMCLASILIEYFTYLKITFDKENKVLIGRSVVVGNVISYLAIFALFISPQLAESGSFFLLSLFSLMFLAPIFWGGITLVIIVFVFRVVCRKYGRQNGRVRTDHSWRQRKR